MLYLYGVIFLLFLLYVFLLIKISRYKKQLNKNLITMKQLHFNKQQKINEVVLNERQKLAQNLHDDLAGTLSALKNIISLVVLSNKDVSINEQLVKANQLVTNMYLKVRTQSHELFESTTETTPSFKSEICTLVEQFFPLSTYNVSVEIENETLQLINSQIQTQLVSVAREAFTNIVKHASASSVQITVFNNNTHAFFIITDNGKGMQGVNLQTGYGLKSINKRVENFNGTLQTLNLTNGFEINIQIPLS